VRKLGWRTRLLKTYRHRIFPRIKKIRGAHFTHRKLSKLAEKEFELIDKEPDSVFDREWDNLIILDACRHDVYEKVTGRDVEKRITLGSSSMEFTKKNFAERDFSDIVYVTANGFLTDELMEDLIGRSGIFHEKFNTVKTDWDKEKGTVMPEPVVRDAKTAENLFPDKKKIIHFLQPHHPFIGKEFGDRMRDPINPEDHTTAYDLAERGKLDGEEIREAYKENLGIVLEKAQELAEELEGKTVITADHGDLIGENELFGHYLAESKIKQLREVPWDVFN
jgi:hypothetical protein